VVAIGEHLVLERKEGATAVHEVEARQPVLERDLLRTQMLLDGDRVVGPALDRRVIRDEHALDTLDTADARHDPSTRRLVVVEAGGGQGGELQKCAAGVE
jgi:hypothetical protein